MSAKNGLIGLGLRRLLDYPLWLIARRTDPSEALALQVRHNPHLYLALCGYHVAGLTDVRVRDLRRPLRQDATATVSAVPVALPGVAAGAVCEGEIRFRYGLFDVGHWIARSPAPIVGIEEAEILARRGAPPAGLAEEHLVRDLRRVPLSLGPTIWGLLDERRPAAEYAVALEAGADYALSTGKMYGTFMHAFDGMALRVLDGAGALVGEAESRSRYLAPALRFRAARVGEHTIQVSYVGEPPLRAAYSLALART